MNLLTWTDTYLEQAIEDEIALAAATPKYRKRKVIRPQILGVMKPLELAPPKGSRPTGWGAQQGGLGSDLLPQWRRSWSVTGSLIGELGLEIRHDEDEGTVTVCGTGRRCWHSERYSDHPGVDEAVVAAIVRAATLLLIEARDAA